MSSREPPPDEAALRRLVDARAFDDATAAILRAYGAELIGWLSAVLPNDADAYDAFSRMSEDLWRSLVRYDGRCSLRTWCYMLARQAAGRVRNQPRHAREELVSHVPSVAHAVTYLWSTTREDRAREHTVYTEIRRALDEDDQTLLVLRVDRDLPWRDIALVLLGDDATPDALTRKATAIRKQFERVKERLRTLAAERLLE